jgi:hypothetical protein
MLNSLEINIGPLQPFAGLWPGYYPRYGGVDLNDSAIIKNFAVTNNFSYTSLVAEGELYSYFHDTNADTNPSWMLTEKNLSNSGQIIIHEVSGILHGYPVKFCTSLLPNTSGGNHASGSVRDTAKKGIVRITFPVLFPQILLDSNKNDPSYKSTIPRSFKKDQLLQLEGKFSTYYDLYAPLNLQINTLSLLSPNFMQYLMDCSSLFDVEFYGNEMILITHDSIYDPKTMADALHALEIQITYLDRLVKSWNYTPISPPFDILKRDFLAAPVYKLGTVRIRGLNTLLFEYFQLAGILLLVFGIPLLLAYVFGLLD